MTEQKLRDILAFPKDDWEAMLRTAVECYSAGRLSQAETILVGLMALDDSDARPVKLLASCLFQQHRHRDAEALYEQARSLDPRDPYALVALGEIKLKALKLGEAIAVFEQLFALDPKGLHPAANRGRKLVREYHHKLVSAP